MKKKISISDKTLKTINKKHLKPIPKWEFVIKNWGLWSTLILCLLLLIVGLALSLFGIIDNVIVPYLWLFIAVIFFIISYFIFEKTKGAYHFPKWQVFTVIIFIGLTMGAAFFKVGLANRLDQQLEKELPYYRHMVPMKLETWNNPSLGYLSGTISKVTNDSNFELKDFNGKVWNITGQNILIKGRISIVPSVEIKLIGSQIDGSSFNATEIRPWTGMGKNITK